MKKFNQLPKQLKRAFYVLGFSFALFVGTGAAYMAGPPICYTCATEESCENGATQTLNGFSHCELTEEYPGCTVSGPISCI